MKVTIIGAGSFVFTRRLVGDILSFPEMRDTDFSFMDIDESALDMVSAWTRRLLKQVGSVGKVEATTDRRRALQDANYVIISIRVGGIPAVVRDFQITAKYGVDHSVGDTMGPGGVFYFLRNGAVIVDALKEMEEVCPEALVLNYTNPMAMNCWAMNDLTTIRNVGLCHSVQGTAFRLADYIGAPRDAVSYWAAGINHMAWYLEFQWKGQDAYPLIYKAMEDPDIYARDRIKFEILEHFGAFVTESSRHMSEYVPYFRRTPELLERYELPSGSERDWTIFAQRRDERLEQMKAEAESDAPIEIERTHEYCARIINAIETDTLFRFNGNVRNTGLITNLPEGCVVEVPIMVDRLGLHPCYVGDLPPSLAALNRSNINVQSVAVEAMKRRDRELVHRAVQLDPLTAAVCTLDESRQMVDELFEAQAPFLPF